MPTTAGTLRSNESEPVYVVIFTKGLPGGVGEGGLVFYEGYTSIDGAFRGGLRQVERIFSDNSLGVIIAGTINESTNPITVGCEVLDYWADPTAITFEIVELEVSP